MNDESARFDLDALNARVADDPGAPEFPALAEALRRGGDAAAAREIAEAGLESAPSRLAGRVALALARMDLGDPERGRAQLEQVLDEMLEPYRLHAEPEAPLEPVHAEASEAEAAASGAEAAASEAEAASSAFDVVGDAEIDAAFDEAEARPEEMHSPNRMAESILDAEAPFEEEPRVEADDTDAADDALGAEPGHEPERGEYDVASSGAFATHTMAGLLEQQGDHEGARSIRTALDDGPAMHASGSAAVASPEALEPTGEPRAMDAAEAVDPSRAEQGADTRDAADRARVLATLERWLHNVQRGVA